MLDKHTRAYAEWKDKYLPMVAGLQTYLDSIGLLDEYSEKLNDIKEQVERKKIELAFIAEFSRGKSELINALFFAKIPDFENERDRIIPSTTGRTTMAPCEIFYDRTQTPFLKLLPIENRESIFELKKNQEKWESYTFDPKNIAQLKDIFQKISATKKVSIKEAKEYFSNYEQYEDDGKCEIPAYRYALINYPSEILEHVSILDTPGLNSIGNEGELTYKISQQVEAVVFILDVTQAGASSSEKKIFNEIIAKKEKMGQFIVINKIDGLWNKGDVENEDDGYKNEIKGRIKEVSKSFNIKENMIFPISAKYAFLGRVRNKDGQIKKSGILDFENAINNDVAVKVFDLLKKKISQDTKQITTDIFERLASKVEISKNTFEQIEQLKNKTVEELAQLKKEKRDLELDFERDSQPLIGDIDVLISAIKKTREALGKAKMDDIVSRYEESIRNSKTTFGKKSDFVEFLEEVKKINDKHTEQTKRLSGDCKNIYNELHKKWTELPSLHIFEEFNSIRSDIDKYLDEYEGMWKSIKMFFSGNSNTILSNFEMLAVRVKETLRNGSVKLDILEKEFESIKANIVGDYQKTLRERSADIDKSQASKDEKDTVFEARKKEYVVAQQNKTEFEKLDLYKEVK